MSIPKRRPAAKRMSSKRRLVSVQSLQLMVRSGVVRRADSMPPPPPKRARVQQQQGSVSKEIVQEQGWLSRVIFGPRPNPALTKRSSFDGGQ